MAIGRCFFIAVCLFTVIIGERIVIPPGSFCSICFEKPFPECLQECKSAEHIFDKVVEELTTSIPPKWRPLDADRPLYMDYKDPSKETGFFRLNDLIIVENMYEINLLVNWANVPTRFLSVVLYCVLYCDNALYVCDNIHSAYNLHNLGFGLILKIRHYSRVNAKIFEKTWNFFLMTVLKSIMLHISWLFQLSARKTSQF